MTCVCSRCVQPYTRTRRWQMLCPKCDLDVGRAACGRGEQFTLFASEVRHVRT
jgi:Zn finger protein HypA/HybF involved in hydrogenase expression